MFFWGVGTSSIGSISLGWTATLSSTALAVATIIIPGVDALANSKSLERWFDKVVDTGRTVVRIKRRNCIIVLAPEMGGSAHRYQRKEGVKLVTFDLQSFHVNKLLFSVLFSEAFPQ